ncbi:hypothetical protein [Bacteroides sp.]|uniref:hypothetical protein n=1 Tax=Bacteroides sp. TaxID=29523 RepID=UPI0026362CF3|nr:hypothetical protein [Bacteroides sp.]MDD3036928.1 hypothetical protein [Bacteroides sp.]
MKKLIISIAILPLLLSCKSQQPTFSTLSGLYEGEEVIYKNQFSFHVELELKQDGTCVLQKTVDLGSTLCIGEWSIINDNVIEIKCNNNPALSNIEKALIGGIYIEENIKVIILNKNKLKLDKSVLKRK